MTTKKPEVQVDPADLFYVNESTLATTDAEECQNLYETGTLPEEVADGAFRKVYQAYLTDNNLNVEDMQ